MVECKECGTLYSVIKGHLCNRIKTKGLDKLKTVSFLASAVDKARKQGDEPAEAVITELYREINSGRLDVEDV